VPPPVAIPAPPAKTAATPAPALVDEQKKDEKKD
jgi:hypothetical protein